jgi:hypothetical protein
LDEVEMDNVSADVEDGNVEMDNLLADVVDGMDILSADVEDDNEELPSFKGKEKALPPPRLTRSTFAKIQKDEEAESSNDASDADQLMAEVESAASDIEVFEVEPAKRPPQKGKGEPSKNAGDIEGAKGKSMRKGKGRNTSGRGENAASKAGAGKGGGKVKTVGVIQALVGQVSA